MTTTLEQQSLARQSLMGRNLIPERPAVSPSPHLVAYWLKDEKGQLYCQWRQKE
ncbi:MAG: hypothetical protein F6K03_07250 [Kamptonema sp. SIO4C4]|nr:hypothetical protein [Kamptonema sp. SIO4C4]